MNKKLIIIKYIYTTYKPQYKWHQLNQKEESLKFY